jgi:hypothetical protein
VGLKAYAVLGDEQVFGQVAAPQPVQLVINMAFHEILMDHHRNVESEGMAAVLVDLSMRALTLRMKRRFDNGNE